MTSRHCELTAVGFTHASSVIAALRRNDVVPGTVTSALDPLNTSAPPSRPAVVHVALLVVPLLPLPDASLADVPLPSSNEYAATRPCADARGAVRCATPITVTPTRRIRGATPTPNEVRTTDFLFRGKGADRVRLLDGLVGKG